VKTSWNRYLVWMLVWALMSTGSAWAGSRSSNLEAEALATQQSAVPPGVLYPPLPTNMSLPTYDYSDGETRAATQFTTGSANRARAFGVIWNSQSQTWELTGSGWLSSRHSQTEHGSTENGFCTKCHSPDQASAIARFDNGAVTNANAVPQARIQGATCQGCHPPDDVATILAARFPQANQEVAIYLWKGAYNPASYQTFNVGQEDMLCLHCHEQRHNTDDTAFSRMYAAGVRCIDCHMAEYTSTGSTSKERFHDWKVGTNLPYSCGAQGSVSGCHSEFTVTAAQNIIPFIRQQHMKWWSLPPFNNQPQVAISAHSAMTVAEYRLFWRELAETDSGTVR